MSRVCTASPCLRGGEDGELGFYMRDETRRAEALDVRFREETLGDCRVVGITA